MKFECLSAGIMVVDHLCTPIARLPEAGELVLADALPVSIGGCAANVAMNLARVGVVVGAAGCVGDDEFGQVALNILNQGGVETSGMRKLPGESTSGTLIINVAGQDRRFIHTVGANRLFRAGDIDWETVRQSRILYVGGYLMMPGLEIPGELTELFRKARAAGVRTVLDVVLAGTGDHWSRLQGVLSETDVFLPSADESERITGLSDPIAQAERFRSAGAKTVVITQGDRGTVLVEEGRRIKAGTYPTTFVGGTGAGDAFDAGFIVGMLLGEDSLGSLRWGSALGASCVRAVSATESVFTREEALDFMRQHKLPIEEI